jgi:predicted DNA-binding transcriptional regulator AlpA
MEVAMSELHDTMLAGMADPVLTFKYIKADLGISHATFHRGPRRQLPVVQISDRRLGVRRSDYEAWKAGRLMLGRTT